MIKTNSQRALFVVMCTIVVAILLIGCESPNTPSEALAVAQIQVTATAAVKATAASGTAIAQRVAAEATRDAAWVAQSTTEAHSTAVAAHSTAVADGTAMAAAAHVAEAQATAILREQDRADSLATSEAMLTAEAHAAELGVTEAKAAAILREQDRADALATSEAQREDVASTATAQQDERDRKRQAAAAARAGWWEIGKILLLLLVGITILIFVLISGLSVVSQATMEKLDDGQIVVPGVLAWILRMQVVDPLQATEVVTPIYAARKQNTPDADGDARRQEKQSLRASVIRLARTQGVPEATRWLRPQEPLGAREAQPQLNNVTIVPPGKTAQIIDSDVLARAQQLWSRN